MKRNWFRPSIRKTIKSLVAWFCAPVPHGHLLHQPPAELGAVPDYGRLPAFGDTQLARGGLRFKRET